MDWVDIACAGGLLVGLAVEEARLWARRRWHYETMGRLEFARSANEVLMRRLETYRQRDLPVVGRSIPGAPGGSDGAPDTPGAGRPEAHGA